jgi:N-acetylmuramoyl-L-alanine amidase
MIAAFVTWCSTAVLAQVPPVSTPLISGTPAPAERPIVIYLDAAHGGNDSGALLTLTAPEKEITLNLARRLRQELASRGILCQLVRDGDITLSDDQRAAIVNAADPALYISLHASSLGTGMRVFTAFLPAARDTPKGFLDWNSAQSAILDRSKEIRSRLVEAVQKTKFPIRELAAPLRPLNNLRSPALAIEISPTLGDAAQLVSTNYQQMICAAVANAVASIAPSLRSNTEHHL